MTLESTLALRYLDREMSELESRIMARVEALGPGISADQVRAIVGEELAGAPAAVIAEPEPVIVIDESDAAADEELESEVEALTDAVEELTDTIEAAIAPPEEIEEPPAPAPEPAPAEEPEPDRAPNRTPFWFRKVALGKTRSDE